MIEVVAKYQIIARDVAFGDEGEGDGVEVAGMVWVGEVRGYGGRVFR